MDSLRSKKAQLIRNITFGVEDSLVSTVGVLSGVNTAGVSQEIILLTGIILIFVEAFSMGVGVLLSEHSAKEFAQERDLPLRDSFLEAGVMFGSYFLTGFIPLFPYILFAPSFALWISIGLSLLTLFLLGTISGGVAKIHLWREGLQMALIGGVAIIIGVLVGGLVHGGFNVV